MSNTELPTGWCLVSLADLVSPDGIFKDGDWVESKDQDPDGEVRLVQLADIGDGHFRDRSNRSLTQEKAEELRCTFIQEGDILVARMPEPLGRACIYPGSDRHAVTVVDVCIVRPDHRHVNKRWLMWAINSPQVREQILSYQTGTTRKRISRKNLEKVQIGLPPLAEQHRIAEAIDGYLSRVDSATSNLSLAQHRTDRLASLLLGKAASGGFSEPVEEIDQVDISAIEQLSRSRAVGRWKPVSPIEVKGYSLPPNWTMASLGTLSHASGYGTSTKCDYGAEGQPVLRIPNVQSGTIDLSDVKHAIDTEIDLTKFFLEPGDVLFVRTNGSPRLIGRVGVVDRSLPYAFASYLIRFRLTPGAVEPRWVELVTQSPLWRRTIEQYAASSAGQYNLSADTLSQLPIPLPPLEVQRKTLEAVDVALTGARRLASATTDAETRATHIRSAILARAFTGTLVPQNSAEEPASTLLQRIRAEQEARRKDKVKRKPARRSQIPATAQSYELLALYSSNLPHKIIAQQEFDV
ncbi:restriction endonuclease subunit S [Kitasatospora sp. NPDC002551]|uniref:restriction endonuclease subunit S n=1 Tax=Kitasatospora sp. NPDC002551 TaxID=3154539 RepID=UPI003326EE00